MVITNLGLLTDYAYTLFMHEPIFSFFPVTFCLDPQFHSCVFTRKKKDSQHVALATLSILPKAPALFHFLDIQPRGERRITVPIAEILSGKNTRTLVSMVFT